MPMGSDTSNATVAPFVAAASLFEACFDASPSAQALLGAEGDILRASRQAGQMLAREPADLGGRRLVEFIHEEDRAAVEDALRCRAGDEGSFVLECRLVRPAMPVIWVSIRACRLARDAQSLWLADLHDITEHRRRDAWLTERNALLTALSQNLPGMIYVFRAGPDRGGRLEFVSEGVREIFGVSPQQAMADVWSVYSKVLPEDLELFFQQRDAAIDAATRLHSEFRVRDAQGEIRWCATDSVAGVDADGREVRCGYVSDITERKRYHEARVAADTAQRASQAKSEFLSYMSHELRTPLNAVIGFAQVLQMDVEGTLAPAHRMNAQLIERSGVHLLELISDVLDLSRIEAGDLPLSPEPLGLAPLIHDALAMVREAAERSGVTIADEPLAAPLHVLGDRVRLRQVLVNLLSNAVKYNSAGGRVEMRAWREDDRVLLEVADTGVGLRSEQLQHLFEPFNRLGAEQTVSEGTGLGLVIVKRLVELMGGTLSVTSEPGVGSRFRVSLSRAHAAPDQAVEEPVQPAQPARQATVLYVEDNEINILLVGQIFTLRPTWRLDVARSGAEAQRMVHQRRPDLLLLDMHLGDMSGLDLAEKIESDPATAAIPKVALSADAMPERVREAQARGFAHFLTKPLNVSTFLACLDGMLAAPPP